MSILIAKRILNISLLACLLSSPSSGGDAGLDIKKISGAEYISLYDMMKSFGYESSFDVFMQKGRIYFKSHHAAYAVGLSAVIIDGKLYKSDNPVTRMNGEIMIPFDIARDMIRIFSPELAISRDDSRLVYADTGAPEKLEPQEEKRYTGKDRIAFVVIDAGHGGKDPGAIGKGGSREKDVTLSVSRNIEGILKEKLGGIKIHLVRRDDRFVNLSDRTGFANRRLKKGVNGLFISVHVNASISPKISGYETYFLSQNPTNDEARSTAALENDVIVFEERRDSGKKYNDVDYIEARMITTQIQKESSLLAGSVQKGISKSVRKYKSRGVKKADFYVLRGVLMPAVLVEAGYITNLKEGRSLKSREHQAAVAEGICAGIMDFIKKYNRMIKTKK